MAHYVRGVDLALAVDVGGTKMAAALVDEHGEFGRRATVPTPNPAEAEEVFDALMTIVVEVGGGERLVCCGVGCGGPMTRGGETVSPLNIPGWRDFPLRDRLAERVGVATFVDNDAKALALAEGWRGAALGESNFLAMVVSTGVGGGVVVDGRLLDGSSGNAGHIGHVIVVPDGRRCECGARGCLEAEASGPSIAAITGRPPAEASPKIVARTGRLVGRAVAAVANVCDVRLCVTGGSVALGFGAPFFSAAQDELDADARLLFSRGARIVPAGSGVDGPLLGAAAVGWRGLGRLRSELGRP